eukprot:2203510-Prymnesium_polylepis.2
MDMDMEMDMGIDMPMGNMWQQNMHMHMSHVVFMCMYMYGHAAMAYACSSPRRGVRLLNRCLVGLSVEYAKPIVLADSTVSEDALLPSAPGSARGAMAANLIASAVCSDTTRSHSAQSCSSGFASIVRSVVVRGSPMCVRWSLNASIACAGGAYSSMRTPVTSASPFLTHGGSPGPP